MFAINANVDEVNNYELNKIPTEGITYTSRDTGVELSKLKDIRAPEVLELKVGAQVLLLKNLSTSRGLYNGAKGVVVAFVQPPDLQDPDRDGRLPVVEFEVNLVNRKMGSEKQIERVTLTRENFDITLGKYR